MPPNNNASLSSSEPLWPRAGLEELLEIASSRYAVAFETVSAGGISLDILQIADMKARLDRAIAENALADALNTLPLWAKVWPASIVLGHMLAGLPGNSHQILEIGAGCGLAGLVAAALGRGKVCISDINEDALLFARINILKNRLQDCAEVRRIDVVSDSPSERFSLILGAEILYLDHLYRPLVKFVARHLSRDNAHANGIPGARALLASDHRRKIAPFLKKAEKEFAVSIKQIGLREKSAENNDAAGERHLIDIIRLAPRFQK